MKKAMSFFFSILLILLTFLQSFTVNAVGSDMSNAVLIDFDSQYTETITESTNKHFYKFVIPSSGCINLQITAYVYRTNYYIYDISGNPVWKKTSQYWNDTSKQYNSNENINLTAGTYYFCVEKNSGEGDYKFKLTFKSAEESIEETLGGINETQASASTIKTNTSYKGQLAINESSDFYCFNLSESGKINLQVTAFIYRTNFYIYDMSGNPVWKKTSQYWNDTSKQYNNDENIDLTAGTYCFCVEMNSGTGNYNFILSFASANESFKESQGGNNDSLSSASSISINKTYTGQIAANELSDFFSFKLTSSTNICLDVVAKIYRTNFYIYDSSGNVVWKKTSQYWNETSKQYTNTENISLSSGTYYFCIEKNSGTGNYTFNISTLSSKPETTTKKVTTTIQETTKKVITTKKQLTTTKKPITTKLSVTLASFTFKPYTTNKVQTTRKQTTKKTTSAMPIVTQEQTRYVAIEDMTQIYEPEYTTAPYTPETYEEDIYQDWYQTENNVFTYNFFEYTIVNNEVIINNYYGTDTSVSIPSEIDGYTVVGIKDGAFAGTNVSEVEIPNTVYKFNSGSLESNAGIISVICEPNSPAEQFAEDNNLEFEYVYDQKDKEENHTDIIIVIISVIVISGLAIAIIIMKRKLQ